MGEAFLIDAHASILHDVVVSHGSGSPYKCKVRPPCFYKMGGFHQMVKGSMIADVIANLGSLNIIGGELDR